MVEVTAFALGVASYLYMFFVKKKKDFNQKIKKARCLIVFKMAKNIFLCCVVIFFVYPICYFSALLFKNHSLSRNATYSPKTIRTYEDEYLGSSVDPADFERVEKPKAETEPMDEESNNEDASETADNGHLQDSNGTENITDSSSEAGKNGYTEDSETSSDSTDIIPEPYDYSPLFIYGSYEYEGFISEKDITNMKHMYKTFMDNKTYLSLLESVGKDYGNYSEIRNRINDFDEEKHLNSDVLTSKEYFQNAMDRLFCYERKKNAEILEQSAISAEGAVECEEVGISGGYNNYIIYTKFAVIEFFCVLDYDLETYDSGYKEDIEYRIGKLLYKPSANLKNISSNEKFYSLCSSHVILREAFENSSLDSKYTVEIAYYYLEVCADIANNMESGDARDDICLEAIKAFDEFEKRGEKYPDNLTYINYREDAKIDAYKAKSLLT